MLMLAGSTPSGGPVPLGGGRVVHGGVAWIEKAPYRRQFEFEVFVQTLCNMQIAFRFSQRVAQGHTRLLKGFAFARFVSYLPMQFLQGLCHGVQCLLQLVAFPTLVVQLSLEWSDSIDGIGGGGGGGGRRSRTTTATIPTTDERPGKGSEPAWGQWHRPPRRRRRL